MRFIRFHAERWSVDPERLGGVGGSSGGHLTLMLGIRSGTGDQNDPDPVNRESARLQAIVPWAAPTDLVALNGEFGQGTFGSLFGMRLLARDPHTSPQFKAYRDASPIHDVTADDSPTLLIHGDADGVVPLQHSEMIAARMGDANVSVELLVVPSGGHGALFPGKSADAPDYVQATVDWFDRHLSN